MAQQTVGSNFRASSLYVGDLSPEVTEKTLYDLFESAGHVLSLRICRDRITEKSLGYAYVNYATLEEAEKALETLNFSLIANQPCRIMWQCRDSSLRKSGKGNLYVKNLPEDMDNKTLLDQFSIYGTILSCKVSFDNKTHKSLRFGYVQFEREEDSAKALEELNGKTINGSTIVVEKYNANKRNQAADSWTNCFVKNISPKWDEEKLKTIFGEFGAVQNVCVKTGPASSNFGFVNFESHDAAVKAVESLNNKVFEDNIINDAPTALFVARHMKKSLREKILAEQFKKQKEEQQEKTQGMNVYVRNIPEDFDDKKLAELFNPFGTITSAAIMKTSEGVSRGFGFVCFSSTEEANKAIIDLNGKQVGGKNLYVTLAQRKEERARQFQSAMFRNMPRNVPMANNIYPNYYPYVIPNQMMMPAVMNNMVYNQMPNNRGNGRRMVRQNNNYTKFGHQRPAAMPIRSTIPMNQPAMVMSMPAMAAPQPMSVDSMKEEMVKKISMAMSKLAPITMEAISGMDADNRRNTLGERLFTLINEINPERVAKITGMMLELDPEAIIKIINNPEELVSKVDEAVSVLEQS